ncbi:hypothetical protein HMPREF3196_00411 [Bifidobacterium bifidum]|uniref:Uncharacterized protein n=1 Tax=Bifidobacterium bifidum TaxID=1681 RepID=A0A133KRQ5_BIFBI|nr:hypothetical protein HMPREF3196_00411 [Bifidobacterium bifidum]
MTPLSRGRLSAEASRAHVLRQFIENSRGRGAHKTVVFIGAVRGPVVYL